MPEYWYQCHRCKFGITREFPLAEDKPATVHHVHVFRGAQATTCHVRTLRRKFTIPGMRILRPEEEGGWKIEAPGQVGGPQRNKKWRDRNK